MGSIILLKRMTKHGSKSIANIKIQYPGLLQRQGGEETVAKPSR